jgi:hypothetical protein
MHTILDKIRYLGYELSQLREKGVENADSYFSATFIVHVLLCYVTSVWVLLIDIESLKIDCLRFDVCPLLVPAF